jgi:aspartate/glutamate racemase
MKLTGSCGKSRQNLSDENLPIQAIQEFRPYFVNLIRKYSAVDAVLLACTELPLAIDQSDAVILNSIECQCREAFEFAIRK